MKLGEIGYQQLIALQIKANGANNKLNNYLGNKEILTLENGRFEGNVLTQILYGKLGDNKDELQKILDTRRTNYYFPKLSERLEANLKNILNLNEDHISNLKEYEEFKKLSTEDQLKYYLKTYDAIYTPKGDLIL